MKLKIFHKMVLVGALGFFGMVVLGGIGYMSTRQVSLSGVAAMEEGKLVRKQVSASYDQALANEKTALDLSNINRQLILLLDMVI